MGAPKNKHGLPREMPADVKRAVRQQCGFGCVLCGAGIYDYDHFLPEFHDAQVHDPNGIALLCGRCHRLKKNLLITNRDVAAGRADPLCMKRGFAGESFWRCEGEPTFQLGGATFVGGFGFAVEGLCPLILVLPNPDPGLPFRISAMFVDSNGENTLLIRRNEFKAVADRFDIEFEGPELTIREGRGQVHLRLRFTPPNRIEIPRLSMRLGRLQAIEADDDGLRSELPTGSLRIGKGASVQGHLFVLGQGTGLTTFSPFPEFFCDSAWADQRQEALRGFEKRGLTASPTHRLVETGNGLQLGRTDNGEAPSDVEDYVAGLLCLGNPTPPAMWVRPWELADRDSVGGLGDVEPWLRKAEENRAKAEKRKSEARGRGELISFILRCSCDKEVIRADDGDRKAWRVQAARGSLRFSCDCGKRWVIAEHAERVVQLHEIEAQA